jgi:hypothetical protein
MLLYYYIIKLFTILLKILNFIFIGRINYPLVLKYILKSKRGNFVLDIEGGHLFKILVFTTNFRLTFVYNDYEIQEY